ncbi:AAA family ATPase [Kribbella sp. NBC_01510]|uniref:AAA family ATPase n=1 Tax=Kribbella sp. NBC_01510 TaxID=2903581 RepID=UPI00386A0A12
MHESDPDAGVPVAYMNVGEDYPDPFDPGPDDNPALADDNGFALAVEHEARRVRIREATRAKVAAERQGSDAPPIDAGTLAEILARPAEPPHRVEGLIPSEAGTLIVAQRKTGKTTLELNLARSLILGEDFLGRFPVRKITGRVTLMNYEVSAAQIARWAAEVGIPGDRLFLVNVRGRRNPLTHPEDRAALVAALKAQATETLIVDPFGRAYTGASQNDSGEVGAWLTDLDYFTRGEVGAVDLILATHAGWNGERSRGSSALEDWADSIITLTRDPDDERVRFLKAMGRDVEVDEDQLSFDPATRLITLTGSGSRKEAAKTRHLDAVVQAVVKAAEAQPGITGNKLLDAIRQAGCPCQKGDELKAAALAVQRGALRIEMGPRKAKQYYSASTSPDVPRRTPAGDVLTSPDLPYIDGGGQQGDVRPSTSPETNPTCQVCEKPLHPSVVDGGFTTHPACQQEGAAA